MTRAFLCDIQVDTGLVQAFSLDTLVADDLPRVTPSPAGGYTVANLTVDQWGRVVEASTATRIEMTAIESVNMLRLNHTESGLGYGANFITCEHSVAGTLFSVSGDGSVSILIGDIILDAGNISLTAGTIALSAYGPGLLYQATAGAALTSATTISTDIRWNGTVTETADAGNPGAHLGLAGGTPRLILKSSSGDIGQIDIGGTTTAMRHIINGSARMVVGVDASAGGGAAFEKIVSGSGVMSDLDGNVRSLALTGNDGVRGFAARGQIGQTAGLYGGKLISSTTTQDVFDLICTWIDSTNATRKARVTLNVYDTAIREYLRADADGSNAVCAFGGAVTTDTRLTVIGTTLGSKVVRVTTPATNDDPNYDIRQNRVATTDATVTTLDTIAITASNTYLIEARVVARRTGGAAGTADDGAVYIRRAMVTTKAGTVTINAVQDDLTQEDQAAWDCTLDVSGTNIRIRVTGAVDNNVTWHSTTFVSNLGT